MTTRPIHLILLAAFIFLIPAASAAPGCTLPDRSPDRDCDGVKDSQDNCEDAPNPSQADDDRDALGNACDPDADQTCLGDWCEEVPRDCDLQFDPIPDQEVYLGRGFHPFDLDQYVSDIPMADLHFTHSIVRGLDVRIDGRGRVAVIYDDRFLGSATVIFYASNVCGQVKAQPATFTVKPLRIPSVDGPEAAPCTDWWCEDYCDWHDCDDDQEDRDHRRHRHVHRDYDDEWCDSRHCAILLPPPPPPPLPPLFPPAAPGCRAGFQPDDDCDGVPTPVDNCPTVKNRDQRDANRNGIGDACDLVLVSTAILPSTTLNPGDALAISVDLKNLLTENLGSAVLDVRIPQFNLQSRELLPGLQSEEFWTQRASLRLPDCVPAQTAQLKISVEYRGRSVLAQTVPLTIRDVPCWSGMTGPTQVDVYDLQDIPPGGSAAYPLALTNSGAVPRSYALTATGLEGWGTATFEPGALVILAPGQSKTAALRLTAQPASTPGPRAFAVAIASQGETTTIPLRANVQAVQPVRSYLPWIKGLAAALVVLVVAAAVLYLGRPATYNHSKIVKE